MKNMKKGVGKLLVALGLMLSIVVVINQMLHPSKQAKVDPIIMVMPAIDTITIVKTSPYVLWLRSNTFVNGVRYSATSTTLPTGAKVELMKLSDSSIVPMENAGNSSVSMNGESKVSVLSFPMVESGEYSFMVNNLLEQQVFSLERPMLAGVGKIINKILYIGISAITAFVLIIIGLVQVLRREKVVPVPSN